MIKRLAIVLVIILGAAAIAMEVFDFSARPPIEQPAVVVVFNLVFIFLVMLVIAILAARAYLAAGRYQMLWLGAGSLAFSIGSLIYTIQYTANLNAALTTYCAGGLLAAVFFLHGFFPWGNNVKTKITGSGCYLRTLLIYYLGVFFGLVAIDVLASLGIFPVFYDVDTGPTFLAYVVITAVIVLFLMAFINNQALYFRTRLDFFFWYSLALLLIAVGLLLLVLTPGDSPLSWLGRAIQYTGGLYLVIAVWNAFTYARTRKIDIERTIASFFRDPQANYELLMQSSGDAVIATDGEGRIVMWNPAAEKTFGYKVDEAAGKDICKMFDGQNGGFFRAKLNSLKELKTDSVIMGEQQEIDARRKDGERFPVSVTFSARRIPEGWMTVVIARDTTELKQAREALLRTNEELEARVKERTAELEFLNEQLRQLTFDLVLSEEQERKRIATELHDDVSQMLAVINLELYSVIKKAPQELQEGLKKILDIVQKLINESRSLMFQLSPPILYDLGLEPAVEELAVLIEKKNNNNILITVDWDGQPAGLSTEVKIILFQLIRELFTYVTKHSRATMVKVSFHNNSEFDIKIEDNGAGANPQSDEISKKDNGLRMLQIQERIRDIGGRLEIQAEPGKGTRIIILIPSRNEHIDGQGVSD